MSRVVLLLVSILASACGPSRFEDLPRPALVVIVGEPGGFCTSVFAVDANDAVWSSNGCGEDSGTLQRAAMRVSGAERAELDRMMDEVLALSDDPECGIVSPSGSRYRFVRTAAGTSTHPETRQCDPGVPLVARELAARMRALTAPPIPDAAL